MTDLCLKYVVRQVAKAFAIPAFEVEEVLSASYNLPGIEHFFTEEGPSKLLVYRRAPGEVDATGEPVYVVCDEDKASGKGVVLLKLKEGGALTPANIEGEVEGISPHLSFVRADDTMACRVALRDARQQRTPWS